MNVLAEVLPSTILKLVTTYKSQFLVQIEFKNVWLCMEMTNTDTMNADSYKGPFTNIKDAFDASVVSPRVLIDQYILSLIHI